MDPLKNLHVLVVDDEAIIGMLIEDIFLDAGCATVTVKGNLDDARSYLAEQKPDFVVLDVNLAGTTSYPLADDLRASGTPFIFLSGYGAQGLDPAYADCAALPKPFQHEQLLAAARDVIAARAP